MCVTGRQAQDGCNLSRPVKRQEEVTSAPSSDLPVLAPRRLKLLLTKVIAATMLALGLLSQALQNALGTWGRLGQCAEALEKLGVELEDIVETVETATVVAGQAAWL